MKVACYFTGDLRRLELVPESILEADFISSINDEVSKGQNLKLATFGSTDPPTYHLYINK